MTVLELSNSLSLDKPSSGCSKHRLHRTEIDHRSSGDDHVVRIVGRSALFWCGDPLAEIESDWPVDREASPCVALRRVVARGLRWCAAY